MMSEPSAAEPAHERTYTYQEYLKKFSRHASEIDGDADNNAESQDPEKLGEEMGKRIIERLTSGQ